MLNTATGRARPGITPLGRGRALMRCGIPQSGINSLDSRSWLPQPRKQHTSHAENMFSTACQLLTFLTKRLPTACRVADWTCFPGVSAPANPAPSAAEVAAAAAAATWLAAGSATTAGSADSAGSPPKFTGCAELVGWALGSSATSSIALAKACNSALLSACGTLPAGAATWPLCVAHKVTLAASLPSCGS